MARTEVRSAQIKDSTVGRADIDTVTPGAAIVAKIVAGSGVSLSWTGADSGTGDVTITNTASGSGDVVGPASAVDNSVALYSGTTGKLIKDASQVTVNPATGYITTPGGIILGTNPATAGIIRLPNNGIIYGRNAANTVDVNIIGVNTDNNIYVGQAGVNLLPNNNNAQDIGLSSGWAWRNAYLSGALSIGATPASSGLIRIPVSYGINFRNNANSADIVLIESQGDVVSIGAGSNWIVSRGTLFPGTDATYDLGDSGTRWRNVVASGAFIVGTSPATTGAIRIPNNAAIVSRNGANSTDIGLLRLDSSNYLYLGDSTVVGSYLSRIYPYIDAISDIGSGASRWRDIYLSGNVNAGGLGSTPLNASNLTSGTVPDARLTGTTLNTTVQNNTTSINTINANAAFKNVANTFTSTQTMPGETIQGTQPTIVFYKNDAPTDSKYWYVYEAGSAGDLNFQAYNDAGNIAQSTPIVLRRTSPSIYFPNGQLQFPSTASPSSDVNTLDDYKEGTWIPQDQSGAGTVMGGGTTGQYTKIGRQVVVQFIAVFSGNSSGLQAIIGPLPYGANNAGYHGGCVSYTNAGATMTLSIAGTQIYFYNVSGGVITMASLSGKEVRGTVVYFV